MRSKVSFLIFTLSIIIIGIFTSCARHSLPTAKERSYILGGKKTIVLLRITCELEDGTSVEPFRSSFYADNINIGLGGFLVGGKVRRVEPQRFLSPETRKQGWIYLILKPGIHYIVFQTSQQTDAFTWNKELRYAPRFRVNIPKNKLLVYIGTLHLYCHGGTYLFEGKYFAFFDRRRMVVRNEESLAENLTTEYLSDFGSPQTVLMQFFY